MTEQQKLSYTNEFNWRKRLSSKDPLVLARAREVNLVDLDRLNRRLRSRLDKKGRPLKRGQIKRRVEEMLRLRRAITLRTERLIELGHIPPMSMGSLVPPMYDYDPYQP